LHLGTTELLARTVLLDGEELGPGESGLVQFRLESPTCALPGDRFIIRRYSPQITIGGGVIIDGLPEKHRIFRADAVRSLSIASRVSSLEKAAPAARLSVWTTEAGHRGLTIDELTARSGLTNDEIAEALSECIAQGHLIEVNAKVRSFISTEALDALRGQMKELLEQFHRANPLADGMSREELRQKVLPDSKVEFSAALISSLAQDPLFRAERDWVALANHQVTLTSVESEAQERLLKLVSEAGYEAPTLEEATERLKMDLGLARKLLHLCVTRGQLVRVGDLIFAANHVHALIAQIRALKSTTSKLDVPTFKELTGVTRKYAIPLLEYLDRQGVTRRAGNDRIIV
jgi:selenocysteine-specific elongation factor